MQSVFALFKEMKFFTSFKLKYHLQIKDEICPFARISIISSIWKLLKYVFFVIVYDLDYGVGGCVSFAIRTSDKGGEEKDEKEGKPLQCCQVGDFIARKSLFWRFQKPPGDETFGLAIK